MTRRSIVLSDEQIGVIQTLVGSGRFADAEAVVDAGLRLVVSHARTEAEKRGALRAAIQVGLDDLENGRFREFETEAALAAHLDELLAEVSERGKARCA